MNVCVDAQQHRDIYVADISMKHSRSRLRSKHVINQAIWHVHTLTTARMNFIRLNMIYTHSRGDDKDETLLDKLA